MHGVEPSNENEEWSDDTYTKLVGQRRRVKPIVEDCYSYLPADYMYLEFEVWPDRKGLHRIAMHHSPTEETEYQKGVECKAGAAYQEHIIFVGSRREITIEGRNLLPVYEVLKEGRLLLVRPSFGGELGKMFEMVDGKKQASEEETVISDIVLKWRTFP